MVRFVGNKVAQEMCKIGREVLPESWRDLTAARRAKTDQSDNTIAAAFKRFYKLRLPNFVDIDRLRHLDAMPRTDTLDPTTSRIVNMRCHPSNRSVRVSRYFHRP